MLKQIKNNNIIIYIPLLAQSNITNKVFNPTIIIMIWYLALIMLQVKIGSNVVNFGLIIVNMQNGFVSNGGSYDKLGHK